ncbi:hypothetical protein E3P92_02346 [Wallemia ichthyophaga]|uniref:PCI domain-containing protein n=2 Tax=Wallemia ichthyophaga TaxID=245174 RepID=A0A4T0LBY9_WALIC|nr:hypothetical protein E3P90_02303 [Wallemia ichthyophaga]TIB13078.1 hypothetical protein E3P93_02063 [Wallemia ichthyophaga]TIB13131.1 hypothetical protein E3P92_02346 [Wallemia ichthyophaga]TIB22289.1 hypothetical protein E3P89_02168 [Wallemia ichthyophaga]TIB23963.1 hypothetical protein E3P88_02259 [Wallemia ichthyophaga]
MSSTAKAKTAKLIRTLIDFFDQIENSRQAQLNCLVDNITWAKSEKRVFLRQSLEIRLAGLYYESKEYKAALDLLDGLLKELKKLDDKIILTQVHNLESKIYYSTANYVKSKAALTSARTAGNAIYCPPILQAQLDLQSGILHANDRDWKTAFSYFFETLEAFSSQDDDRAVSALKYMLLCKIMLNLSDDVDSIIQNKMSQRYAGANVEAMKAVAQAHKKRSLTDFEKALKDYKQELSADPIIKSHLSSLYDTLLESNLLKIIEPYSRVEIDYMASLLSQPVNAIEGKLSQMILDKVFYGIIDQGNNCLIVFDPPHQDHLYDATLKTLGNVGQVVNGLFEKTASLQSWILNGVYENNKCCVDIVCNQLTMVIGLGLSLHSLPRRRFGPRDPSGNDGNLGAPKSSPAASVSPLLFFPEPENADANSNGPPALASPPPPAPPAAETKGKKERKKSIKRKPLPKDKDKHKDNDKDKKANQEKPEAEHEGENKGTVAFINTPTLVAEDFYSEDGHGSPMSVPMANADDEPIIEDLFHEIERDSRLLKAEHDKENDKRDYKEVDAEKEDETPAIPDTSASEAETSNTSNTGGGSGSGKKKKKKKGKGGGAGGAGGGEKPADKPTDEAAPKSEENVEDKPTEDKPAQDKSPLPPTPDAPPAPPKDEIEMKDNAPPTEAGESAEQSLPIPPVDIKIDGPAEIKIDPPIDGPAEIKIEPPESDKQGQDNPAMNPPKAPTTAVSSSFGDMDSTAPPLSTPPTSPPASRPGTPPPATTPNMQNMPPAHSQYDPQTMFEDGRPSLLSVAFHAIAFNKDSLAIPPHPGNDVLMNSTINMVDRDVDLLPQTERTGFTGEVSEMAKQLIAASNELRKAWHGSM